MLSVLAENNITLGPEISWPKDFPELKLIDEALRCGICYDYIKTCMVTPCAHSYCSICIRKYLGYKQACPNCFEETFETNLRNNRNLDRIIELFVRTRDKLIKYIRVASLHFNEQSQSPVSSQNQKNAPTPILESTPKNSSKKPLKSSSSVKGILGFSSGSSPSTSKSEISKRLEDILGSPASHKPKVDKMECLALEENLEISKIPTVPSMFLQPKPEPQPKPSDIPSVSCPVCGVSIPERNINAHLDICLANVDKPPIKSPVKSKPKRNPLPKMVWHMMGEKDLRKKLKEHGLNTQGDKKALISRIQRYIILYNSECDSDNPRPVSEIIRQVEREEKQAPTQTNQRTMVINKKSDPKLIEEENKKYIQENKDSFKKLIEAMREREGKNIRPLRHVNRISSDEEEDNTKTEKCDMKGADQKNESFNHVKETVNLCDSNDERSSSPVLDMRAEETDKTIVNGLSSDISEDSDIFLLNQTCKNDKKTPIKNAIHRENSRTNSDEHSPSLLAETCEDVTVESLFSSSPMRAPSPSCIITHHTDSESEDSISLLLNHIDEDDRAEAIEEGFTEQVNVANSQLDDPDFVLNTEEQQESEEIMIPQRKSKRKLRGATNGSTSEIPSPRRTRRRLNK